MKIARIQRDDQNACYAIAHEDDRFTLAHGELYEGLTDSGEEVSGKLLALVLPANILCIGLNYRDHAEQAGLELPQHRASPPLMS